MVREIERSPTPEEVAWYSPLHATLLAVASAYTKADDRFKDNLIFYVDHVRTLLLAYQWGEEDAATVCKYAWASASYFGFPAPLRLSLLGVVGEAIATASPRNAAPVKGHRPWFARSVAMLVSYGLQQGKTQKDAIAYAIDTAQGLGLPSDMKPDTVKRWAQEGRASDGADALSRGRPKKGG